MSQPSLSPAEADALLMNAMLDDEGRQDPTVAYRQFHASCPVWKSASGATVLASYHECLESLRNPKWGRPEPDMDLPEGFGQRSQRASSTVNTPAMLFLNPPDHTRIRSLVSRAFTPKRVESLRPKIDALLSPVLEQFAESGSCDVMSTLAIPFPVAVISELLAVPIDPTGRFSTMVRDSTAFIDVAATEEDLQRAEVAVVELAMFFLDLFAHKRSNPDDGLLSALIEVEEAGDRLSEEELLANTILMYAAGFETTSNLIGNGLYALLRNPDQLARLREDPTLMPSAVWEMLRFDSPVQLNARTALQDDEFMGKPVHRGEQVIVLQGAANHDPSVYENPECFDVARFVGEGVAQPLSFGWGAHHCLGAHLARAEGEIIFSRLVTRFSSIELTGPVPRYRPSFTLRGLDQLNVEVVAAQ